LHSSRLFGRYPVGYSNKFVAFFRKGGDKSGCFGIIRKAAAQFGNGSVNRAICYGAAKPNCRYQFVSADNFIRLLAKVGQ
jgi:hypothetical protein